MTQELIISIKNYIYHIIKLQFLHLVYIVFEYIKIVFEYIIYNKMVCYSFDEWSLAGFNKSTNKNKKYDACLIHKESNKVKLVPFGDKRYEHYKDTTGNGTWSHLDHNDKERRKRYRARHKNDNLDCYSAGYFSFHYLW
jgi:hypothetical protein